MAAKKGFNLEALVTTSRWVSACMTNHVHAILHLACRKSNYNRCCHQCGNHDHLSCDESKHHLHQTERSQGRWLEQLVHQARTKQTPRLQ